MLDITRAEILMPLKKCKNTLKILKQNALKK